MINETNYKFLNRLNLILPRAYVVPKIYKDGASLRIIISSIIGSPLHNLIRFLHKILVNNLSSSNNTVRKSSYLIKNICNIKISDKTEILFT